MSVVRGAYAPAWRPQAVYAIRYATRPSALRYEHFYGHDDSGESPMPVDYFVWLIAGPGAALLVDAGFTPETARSRPGRVHLGSPLDVAERLGYGAGSIPSIVLTHAHYDHTGYLQALPEATVHVQRDELAFWTGEHARRAMYREIVNDDDIVGLVRRNFAGTLDILDGDSRIAPGVDALLVGGHTAGMQVVRVQLESGEAVVLASDATHFYENIEQDRPFSIAHTVPAMLGAFERIRRLARNADGSAGIIVPGHDPAVRERFTEVLSVNGVGPGVLWRIV